MPPAYFEMQAHLCETTRSESAQIRTRDHPLHCEMETIHEDGVKAARDTVRPAQVSPTSRSNMMIRRRSPNYESKIGPNLQPEARPTTTSA